jgi:ribosomal protein S18 acetylase RimI-like enzyme
MMAEGLMVDGTAALASVTLRQARADDEPFLRALYASTRERELAIVPWPEEQKAAFLRMQFDAQDSSYRARYPDAQRDVIEVARVPAGRLYVFAGAGELRVIDVALLPQFRNQGIGGSVMRTVLRTASGTGRVVTIHVEVDNPARHLYERLRFAPVEQRGTHLLMRWAPSDNCQSWSAQHTSIA